MGQPAARVTDYHMCPLVNPGPAPHVGGPILPPGKPTVLIGNLPAARMGDKALCVGPMDVIIQGAMNVLIGGMPAARMLDSTAHGGKILRGEFTVLIGTSGGGPGAGFVAADGSPGGQAQRKALKDAKKSGAPFAEVCPYATPPVVPPSPMGPMDFPLAPSSEKKSMSQAKQNGQALVPVTPAPASGDPLITSKTGVEKGWGESDFKPSFAAEHTLFKEEMEVASIGDDNNFLKAGVVEAKATTGIKVTEDSVEANLIKTSVSTKALQGQVGAEGEYGKATLGAEVLSTNFDSQVGATFSKDEVFIGANAEVAATVAKVEAQGVAYIPIPLTNRKIVIGGGAEASFGAKAEAGASIGRNEKLGSYVGFKLGAALGFGVGGHFILGVK